METPIRIVQRAAAEQEARMLFKRDQWQGIADGTITVAYRRWTRPTVKKGGRLRTPACVLAIDDVTKLANSARITNADAKAAGFASAQALKAILAKEGDLYRVRFHAVGDDERVSLRANAATSDDDVKKLGAALAKLDATKKKPWTIDMLALIAAHPATRAAELAASVKRETLDFKTDVRKLKALGLTESLDVGYRLSKRGAAWLERVRPGAVAAHDDDGTRLADDVLAALSRWKKVGVRAGSSHAFVDVWPVVVDRRLYVRSLHAHDGGWWRAFTHDADGAIRVSMGARGTSRVDRVVDVRAVLVDDDETLDAIDAEYRRKFATKNALATMTDIVSHKARATTLELQAR